jgi:hypothetical protein
MEDTDQIWEEITLDSAKFILEQVEKKLQATIDTANSLTNRAVNTMQFSIPLSVGLIGIISADPSPEWLWLYLIDLLFLIIISFLAMQAYELTHVMPLGDRLGKLLDQATLHRDNEHQYKSLIANRSQEVQACCEKNESINRECQSVLFGLMILVKGVIVFSAAYIPMGLLLSAERLGQVREVYKFFVT